MNRNPISIRLGQVLHSLSAPPPPRPTNTRPPGGLLLCITNKSAAPAKRGRREIGALRRVSDERIGERGIILLERLRDEGGSDATAIVLAARLHTYLSESSSAIWVTRTAPVTIASTQSLSMVVSISTKDVRSKVRLSGAGDRRAGRRRGARRRDLRRRASPG